MSPTLADLIEKPELVRDVPMGTIPALMGQCAALQSGLAARLACTPTSVDSSPMETDQLLTAEEAAKVLGVSPRWVYRHASGLPFTRRLSPKAIRFNQAGLRKWLATRATARKG